MGSQERDWQQRIIDGAKAQNDLSSLFWAIEWEREEEIYQLALIDGKAPVVPLAPGVEEATQWAHMLMLILQSKRPGKFSLWLTHKEILDGLGCPWCVYGDEKHGATNTG